MMQISWRLLQGRVTSKDRSYRHRGQEAGAETVIGDRKKKVNVALLTIDRQRRTPFFAGRYLIKV